MIPIEDNDIEDKDIENNSEEIDTELICIKCCFYSICLDDKMDSLEGCGATDEELDFTIEYPDKDGETEIYWKEMSYYKFNGNSLEVELSEYELEEW